MDKVQKELLKTYYHSRGVAVAGPRGGDYKPYEYSNFALKNGIMDLESLPISTKYKLYDENKRVRGYVAPYLDAYNEAAKGFLKLLLTYQETGDGTALRKFLSKSEFIKENGDLENVDVDGNQIDVGVGKDKLLNHINLEWEYDHVNNYTAGEYYNYWDDNDYLHSHLWSHKAKINKIAKILGVDNDEIETFWEKEGALAEFLSDNDMGQVIDAVSENYTYAKGEAEAEAAREQLETFPFEFEYSYGYRSSHNSILDVENTIKYFYQNDPSPITSFDSFLSYVEDNNDLNEESIQEDAENNMDYGDINFYVNRELDEILSDFEDPDSKYYERLQGQHEMQDLLKKYGFELIPKADNNSPFAIRKQKDKTIGVVDWGHSDDGELQLELEIEFMEDLDKGDHYREGWINAKNLGNYVDQYEIPELRENFKI